MYEFIKTRFYWKTMQNITGLQFSADSDSCFQFIFHLVVDSSDDFADEFEGQSPKLSPLPLQTVRADQSLTHHSAKTRHTVRVTNQPAFSISDCAHSDHVWLQL